jgi:iron-sulfur cluster assembly accessory protein
MEMPLQASQFDPSNMIATSRPPLVDFTDEALQEVMARLEKNKSKGIYFGLTGGGCAGFSYVFNYANGPVSETDIEIDFGKFKVWMDMMSEMYLAGTIISWKVEGLNEQFEFINPAESSACGCGVSVSF